MAASDHQVHDKFKSFVGTDIEAISTEVSAFVTSSGVKPISIGIVHVNSANELLFSLGYQEGEPGHSASLTAVNLGHIDTVHASGLEALDSALDAAAADIDNIICHELLVSGDGDFSAVFLLG